jgi:hypothetical protein
LRGIGRHLRRHMATEHNPDTRHETRTLNVRMVLSVMAAFVVLGILTHFLVTGLMRTFEQGRKPLDNNPNPILTSMPKRQPPQPRLQPNPVGDLHNLRVQEDQILQGYAWVDEKQGKVRIPIARAMQLLVERGLPPAMGAPPPAGAAQNQSPQEQGGSGTGR